MERDQETDATGNEGEWLPILPEKVAINSSNRITERRIRLWALVLDSRSVPCRIELSANKWRLLTSAEQLSSAINELQQFEEKNRDWPPPPPLQRPLAENTLATLSVLLLLALFHNMIQLDPVFPGQITFDWIELGSASGDWILSGQWWRVVTSLTLHVDGLHLISNITIGGVFILMLCRELGSGLAWSLLIFSGALGNLANAWIQPPSHSSVGASTLVFGAVGILAAISLLRYRMQLQSRWPLPLAAALAILALLGTEGKNTDIGAHLFGFAFGLILGLTAEYFIERHGHPGRYLNAMLSLLSACVVLASWRQALSI
ncbi:MAG: rhomboid family intramembrane serine protease [Deltaproteobacteria bacterium]